MKVVQRVLITCINTIQMKSTVPIAVHLHTATAALRPRPGNMSTAMVWENAYIAAHLLGAEAQWAARIAR